MQRIYKDSLVEGTERFLLFPYSTCTHMLTYFFWHNHTKDYYAIITEIEQHNRLFCVFILLKVTSIMKIQNWTEKF